MQKISNPKFSVISYDCRSPKMRVSAEPSLYLDLERSELELDQNPLGDRVLCPVSDLKFRSDFSGIEFSSFWKGESERFDVKSSYPIDKFIYGIISEILTMPRSAGAGFGDVFQFSFEKGKFVSFNLMRLSRDGVVEKSIRVVEKEGVIFMVIPSPWKRVGLKKVIVAEGRVSLISFDDVFEYDLLLPECISRFLPGLFSFIPGAVDSI
ncbi:hypothetical protein PD5205_02364 [Xanthomonas fragariae]|uniref:Uncharacterized protein n=3 Tax=Xanthomonas fragariae TaxID=48664 RepID=A0A1Y6HM87_9XANT|nr:hypothetical protein [Xanthomonas fragariae]MDM7574006.1 hypothetical protein [Xanthomonas fragariae]MEA5212450.1 hypothetical protein [Xanthomonas fragariae]SMQ95702.1 hypothetical protein NBC2815_02368 [Xanthomonas fragariae]SMQ99635.1 hypothetical protein PD885_02397 [Xanthomonas fragariae]SMR03661.1 hypothetical protein PD5205_02364 [Xanthomonas fragariae]